MDVDAIVRMLSPRQIDKFMARHGRDQSAEVALPVTPAPPELPMPPVAEPQHDWDEVVRAGYYGHALRALVAFARQHGYFDPKVAMREFERLHPQAEMASGSGGWHTANRDDGAAAVGALLEGDDEAFLRVAIPNAIRQVRGL